MGWEKSKEPSVVMPLEEGVHVTFLAAKEVVRGTLEGSATPDSTGLVVSLEDNPAFFSGRLFCPADNGVLTFEGTLSELYAGSFLFTPFSSSLAQRRRNERVNVKLLGVFKSHDEILEFVTEDLSVQGAKIYLKDEPSETLLVGENVRLELELTPKDTLRVKAEIAGISDRGMRVKFLDATESDLERLHMFILVTQTKNS